MAGRTSLTDVVAADTTGMSLVFSFSPADFSMIDDLRGDLSKTAIATISATDADNKVYILNCGTGGSIASRNWYKIRITRNGTTGYSLQYATLQPGSAVSSISVTKDANYNFKYVHLANGAVDAEPLKDLWDLKWSYQVYETTLTGVGLIPYGFADFITLNSKAGVQAAEVLNTTVTYDNYSTSHISTTTFSSAVDAVGDKWRSTQPATGIRTDRFYVLKDGAGNAYKIRFLAMGLNDGGTRGKLQLEYKLVK